MLATEAPLAGRRELRRVSLVGEELHGRRLEAIGVSCGSAPVCSYSLVSSRVATLDASTSGWSNGLMPITAPATAVANSQRKTSPPRS